MILLRSNFRKKYLNIYTLIIITTDADVTNITTTTLTNTITTKKKKNIITPIISNNYTSLNLK